MSRRGAEGSPVTLFSFQDIITSVSGILLLLVLIYAVDLATRTQTTAQVQSVRDERADRTDEIAKLREDIATGKARRLDGLTLSALERERTELKARKDALTRTTEALEEQRGAIVGKLADRRGELARLLAVVDRKRKERPLKLIPEVDREAQERREPVVVVMSGQKITCGLMNGPSRQFLPQQKDAFLQYVGTFDVATHTFVFMLEATSAPFAMEWIDAARSRGAVVGWEPMEEGRSIAFGG